MKQYIKRIINISLLLAVVFCGSMDVKAYDIPEDVPYAKCEYVVPANSSTAKEIGKIVLIYNDGKIEKSIDCNGYSCAVGKYVTFELPSNLSTKNFADEQEQLFCPPLYYKIQSTDSRGNIKVIVKTSPTEGGMKSLSGEITTNGVTKTPKNNVCSINTNNSDFQVSIIVNQNGDYECVDEDDDDPGCNQGIYKININDLNKGDLTISDGKCQIRDTIYVNCSSIHSYSECTVSSKPLSYLPGDRVVDGEINEDSQKNADTLADDLADFEFNFEYKEGCASLGSLQEEIMKIYHIVEAVLGVGLVGLTIMDYTKAVTTSDDVAKETKKATKNFTTRIVIFIVLILLPSLIRFFLGAIGLGDYVCF